MKKKTETKKQLSATYLKSRNKRLHETIKGLQDYVTELARSIRALREENQQAEARHAEQQGFSLKAIESWKAELLAERAHRHKAEDALMLVSQNNAKLREELNQASAQAAERRFRERRW